MVGRFLWSWFFGCFRPKLGMALDGFEATKISMSMTIPEFSLDILCVDLVPFTETMKV